MSNTELQMPARRQRRHRSRQFTFAAMHASSLHTSQTTSATIEPLEFNLPSLAESSQQLVSNIRRALPLQLGGLQQDTSDTLSTTQETQDSKPQRRGPPWLQSRKNNEQSNQQQQQQNKLTFSANPDETATLIAVESTRGRKRVYYNSSAEHPGTQGWDMIETAQTAKGQVLDLVKSYILPQGFPESVAPQYASYMAWRGVQYAFGGAISVYTTQSLLKSLGVAGKYTGEAAAAISWVIKDGAGRLGRLLFARWGRELDCELKQFRLIGDFLMEGGAALELSTIFAPKAFLPLACTANLAKNLAAVAASSTRAPIYRTFALQNNLADITAKGESVANLADILGTFAGIMLSRAKLPLIPTFCFLSAGYILASRKEVDAVELPYFNRARLGYAVQAFLQQGKVPCIGEANHNEPLLPGIGFNNGRVVLGSNVESACKSPGDLRAAVDSSRRTSNKFILSYRPDKKQVHILLKEGATGTDCLRAVFTAHLFLYTLDGHSLCTNLPAEAQKHSHAAQDSDAHHNSQQQSASILETVLLPVKALTAGQEDASVWQTTLSHTYRTADALYPEFIKQAEKLGWKLNQTMLNPKETRLLKLATPL